MTNDEEAQGAVARLAIRTADGLKNLPGADNTIDGYACTVAGLAGHLLAEDALRRHRGDVEAASAALDTVKAAKASADLVAEIAAQPYREHPRDEEPHADGDADALHGKKPGPWRVVRGKVQTRGGIHDLSASVDGVHVEFPLADPDVDGLDSLLSDVMASRGVSEDTTARTRTMHLRENGVDVMTLVFGHADDRIEYRVDVASPMHMRRQDLTNIMNVAVEAAMFRDLKADDLIRSANSFEETAREHQWERSLLLFMRIRMGEIARSKDGRISVVDHKVCMMSLDHMLRPATVVANYQTMFHVDKIKHYQSPRDGTFDIARHDRRERIVNGGRTNARRETIGAALLTAAGHDVEAMTVAVAHAEDGIDPKSYGGNPKTRLTVKDGDLRATIRIAPNAVWATGGVRIDGAMPATMAAALVGRRLADVVDHPAFGDVAIAAVKVGSRTTTLVAEQRWEKLP